MSKTRQPPTFPMNDIARSAMDHIRYLSETIGGRGSCTPAEREAAEYVCAQLEELGVQGAAIEEFRGSPSTYRPYVLAFVAGLLGSILTLWAGSRAALAAGAALNLLGAWAMLAETDFMGHWARWLLPRATSINVVGVIPPAGAVKHRAVLCAHLDTHRTPVFYSSKTWQRIFGFMVSASFLSLVLGGLGFAAGSLLDLAWLRWLAIAVIPFQGFVLVLLASADFTPFSPGANDNASGVAVTLSLAERLVREPLSSTEVRLVFTGCEETASYGIIDYLDKHARALGPEAVYIALDEVGLGHPKYITKDGLILKHPTHPLALKLARQAAAQAEREAFEMVGVAYCDALPATKRGLIAVTVSSVLPSHKVSGLHWHQMSDRLEFLDPQSLVDSHRFVWNILQAIEEIVPEGVRQ